MTSMTIAAEPGPQRAAPAVPAARGRRVPWGLRVTGALTLVLLALAVCGPWLAGDVETSHIGARLLGFGVDGHVLGTDGQGRDIAARLLAGARPSLVAGIVPVVVATVVGTALGIVAALAGRVTHAAIMRTLDVFYAFPAVLLAIAIGAALGSGTTNAMVSLAIVLVPPIARMAETETARLRTADFMESGRASGAGRAAIAIRQVLPNIAPPVGVYATSLVGLAIVYAAGLSFLGLGVAPPHAEWGLMIGDLKQYVFSYPALTIVPAVAILLASTVFNVLGNGLRGLLDVRSEAVA